MKSAAQKNDAVTLQPLHSCYMFIDRMIHHDDTRDAESDGARDVHVSSFCKNVCVHNETFCRNDRRACEPFYGETHHDGIVLIRIDSHHRVERFAFRFDGGFFCHQLPAPTQKLRKQG